MCHVCSAELNDPLLCIYFRKAGARRKGDINVSQLRNNSMQVVYPCWLFSVFIYIAAFDFVYQWIFVGVIIPNIRIWIW